MKRQFAKKTDSQNQRFGFEPASNLLHGLPGDASSENRDAPQYSKKWRTFFKRLNEEESIPLPFNSTSENNITSKNDGDLLNSSKSSTIASSLQTSSSHSSIFNRLMGNSDKPANFMSNLNTDNLQKDDQNFSNANEDLYSVFTKKGLKANVDSSTKLPCESLNVMYSPPKFSSSTSCVRSISKALSPSKNLYKPQIPLKKPLEKTQNTNTNKINNSVTRNIPEHLRDRTIIIFTILYSVSSTRKHKKWENDGFLYFDLSENQLCLSKALDKQPIARHPTPRINPMQIEEEFVPGHQTFIGGFEVQVQEMYFSNVNVELKQEKCEDNDEEEAENLIKKARLEDDRHFFDQKMENFLVKTEDDEREPTFAFGLFNDNQPEFEVLNDELEVSENAEVKQDVHDIPINGASQRSELQVSDGNAKEREVANQELIVAEEDT